MNTQAKLAALKNVVLTIAGLTGIGYQQVTGKTDLMLLVVFTTMIGLPGLAQLLALVLSVRQGNTDTLPVSAVSSEQVTELPASSRISASTDGNNADSVRNT